MKPKHPSMEHPAIGVWASLINEQIKLAQRQGLLTVPNGYPIEQLLAKKIYGDLRTDEMQLRINEVGSWLKGFDVPRGDMTHSRLMDAIGLTAGRCSCKPIDELCNRIKQAYDRALEMQVDRLGIIPRHVTSSLTITDEDDDKEKGRSSHDGGLRFMPKRVYEGNLPYEYFRPEELLAIMEKIRIDPAKIFKHSGEYLACYSNAKYKKMGLTPAEIADKIGCALSTYRRLVLGESLPSPVLLEKIHTRLFESDTAQYLVYEECVIRNRVAKAAGHTKEGDLVSASQEFQHLPQPFWAAVMDHRLHVNWNRRASNPLWADAVPHIRSDGEYLWALRHYFGLTANQVANATDLKSSSIKSVEAGDKGYSLVRDALTDFYIAHQQERQADEARLLVPRSERTPEFISHKIMAQLRDMRVREGSRHTGHAAVTQRNIYVGIDYHRKKAETHGEPGSDSIGR